MEIKEAEGINKYLGLMFRTRNTNPLLFEFEEPVMIPIHSYFVFFPFVAFWFKYGKLIEYRVVKPFQINIFPSKRFTELLEIPIQLKGGIDNGEDNS